MHRSRTELIQSPPTPPPRAQASRTGGIARHYSSNLPYTLPNASNVSFRPLPSSETFHRSSGGYHPTHPLQPQDSQSSVITATTDNPDPSRPRTPESPLTTTLRNATTTISDLTSAMANFSKMSGPPLLDSLSCCCGKDECTNYQAWMEFKAKLESRLILCAGELHYLRSLPDKQVANRLRGACVPRRGTRV